MFANEPLANQSNVSKYSLNETVTNKLYKLIKLYLLTNNKQTKTIAIS